MSRLSTDETDRQGRVKNGFDYNLQVWVKDYITQPVGLGARQYAGKDIRTIPGHEERGAG